MHTISKKNLKTNGCELTEHEQFVSRTVAVCMFVAICPLCLIRVLLVVCSELPKS